MKKLSLVFLLILLAFLIGKSVRHYRSQTAEIKKKEIVISGDCWK